MKNKIYINLLIIAGLVIMGTSCTKDWLEVDPSGKTAEADFYKTDDQLTMAVTAAYDMLHSDLFIGWSSSYMIKNLPGDEVNCGGGGSGDQAQYQQIDDFDWTAENAGITAFYQMQYFGVSRCNAIINNSTSTTDLGKRLVAEAKFLRAYFYFDLVTWFGDVPLRLAAPVTPDEGLARTPAAQVWAQIEQDLTDAIAVLPNKGDYTGGNRFRANKQAAQTLLGKAHLYQKDYSAALTALEAVIATEGSQVGLEANFGNVTRAAGEWGIESLLEASFVGEGKDWSNANWDRQADDNRHIQLCGPRSPFNGGSLGLNAGWGFMPPTQKLYDAYDANDPRRLYTVISEPELVSIYGGSFDLSGWDTEGMIRTKLNTYADDTNSEGGVTPELNYGTNWKLLRYADVLLMAAECYNMTNSDALARTQINKLRTRAGYNNPLTNEAGTQLLAIIKNERNVEMAYEGTRFMDLVRWGDADAELSTLGFVAGKHELFPIPLDEINGNSEISAADQNPNY